VLEEQVGEEVARALRHGGQLLGHFGLAHFNDVLSFRFEGYALTATTVVGRPRTER
jgi:hypothetical protein